MTTEGRYVWANSDGNEEKSPHHPTEIDKLRQKMTMAHYPVQDLLMHPDDWLEVNGTPLDQLPLETDGMIARILQFEDGYCIHVQFKEKA